MKNYIAICLVALLCGCASQHNAVATNADTYLSELQTLDLDYHKYESYQQYYNIVCGRMADWLNRINDPEEFRILFWKCHSAWKAKPAVAQDQLQWIDPHAESKNLILYRLADIRTSDAARVVVDLCYDPKAGWDGDCGLAAEDAVVKCGKVALPFLREKNEAGRDAHRLIRLIESGGTTAF